MKSKIIITALTICLIFITLLSFEIYKQNNEEKAILFMSQYVAKDSSNAIMKWSKYYVNLEWVEVFSTVITESEGRVNSKSRSGNMGLLQISRKLASLGQMRYDGIIDNRDPYSIEFNIATGCMHLNAIRSYLQKDVGKCWVQTYAVYNAGRRGFYIKKYRIGGAINRFIDNLSFYQAQWEKF